MEYVGALAFLLVLRTIGLPGTVKRLQSDIKMLKHRIKGDNKMSEILKELVGKRCKLKLGDTYSGTVECDVVSVDDEWMKIVHYENKDKTSTKIIKIEQINEVLLV